jgi:hypothetical protein
MLDGAVVVLGWVDIALAGDGYTFLRTVRALRPLRTITHIRGLKVGLPKHAGSGALMTASRACTQQTHA